MVVELPDKLLQQDHIEVGISPQQRTAFQHSELKLRDLGWSIWDAFCGNSSWELLITWQDFLCSLLYLAGRPSPFTSSTLPVPATRAEDVLQSPPDSCATP